VGQSKLSGSQSNSRSAAGLSDELVSVRRPPRRSARGVLGMISAITAFGLLGLGLRVVPAVLAGDLTALAAHPQVVPTGSSTSASPTSPTPSSARPPTSRLTAMPSGTPTQKAARKVVVPATGPGTYDGAGQRVKSASNAGRLIRFDVKVEDNLEISADAAANVIAGVLNDQRSWRGSGRWRFELVSGSDQAELHAYIVTPGTTDRLCAPLQTRGEVSCQNGNRIVLNAKRWQQGAKSYGTDLTNYRRYLVNHEFGHYLGYGHVQCPGRGQLAPIMLQQTKGLDGCRKNPWVQSD
jgi:ssRNA-specific RNase YbeY (16S rRNA maturation enzyme)